ncbi:BURP domain-containing protein 3-like [Leptopilina heterotoma]|uniref:BURP domain-containing protein 3-like n=1 Tax=Leptopilina heterotoma TaxID=63436 RepID=UPI001CA9ABD4|nr:BURP domain-containing protein 3-like [Leptopilina heterotoma]
MFKLLLTACVIAVAHGGYVVPQLQPVTTNYVRGVVVPYGIGGVGVGRYGVGVGSVVGVGPVGVGVGPVGSVVGVGPVGVGVGVGVGGVDSVRVGTVGHGVGVVNGLGVV